MVDDLWEDIAAVEYNVLRFDINTGMRLQLRLQEGMRDILPPEIGYRYHIGSSDEEGEHVFFELENPANEIRL